MTTPTEELRDAAVLLRNPIRRPEIAAVVDLPFTEPLADWLESVARRISLVGADWTGPDRRHALAIARAITGGGQ